MLYRISHALPHVHADGSQFGGVSKACGVEVEEVLGNVVVRRTRVGFGRSWCLDDDRPFLGLRLPESSPECSVRREAPD
jgi:hypothetical protein